MHSNLAYSAYSQNNISIESSEKLIKMLYEGVLKFVSLAKRSMGERDIEKRLIGLIVLLPFILNSLIHSIMMVVKLRII